MLYLLYFALLTLVPLRKLICYLTSSTSLINNFSLLSWCLFLFTFSLLQASMYISVEQIWRLASYQMWLKWCGVIRSWTLGNLSQLVMPQLTVSWCSPQEQPEAKSSLNWGMNQCPWINVNKNVKTNVNSGYFITFSSLK